MAGDVTKIALVTDAIGPFHHGGKEMRYFELAQRLAARAQVTVYTMNWWRGDGPHREGNVTYRAIAPFFPLYSGERRSIRQALVFAACCLRLLFEDFDVIEADHMPYIQLFTLRLVALVRRRRLVVTWHECWGPEYWRTYLGQSGRIGWWCERLSMRLPHTIIAASPQTGDRLREFTAGRVEVVVAPNGINVDAIDATTAVANPAEVIVVGRLLSHKRVDLVLEALAILREEGTPTTARVVGSGPQYETLRAQAAALDLADFVDFRRDVLTVGDLYAELKSGRVAVFASEREGFGIAVLEALACGVPVVTTSAVDNLARHLVEQAPPGAGVVCEPTARALADAIGPELRGTPDPAPDTAWLRRYDWSAIADIVYEVLS